MKTGIKRFIRLVTGKKKKVKEETQTGWKNGSGSILGATSTGQPIWTYPYPYNTQGTITTTGNGTTVGVGLNGTNLTSTSTGDTLLSSYNYNVQSATDQGLINSYDGQCKKNAKKQ